MPAKTWTLLDHANNEAVADGWQLNSSQLELPDAAVQVTQHCAGLSQGVTTVRLTRGPLQAEIVPTRGMGVWRLACNGVQLGWKSPTRGPVHPSFVPLTEPGGLGWLDGFDEFLVRCGLESNGAPEFDDQGRLAYPLHGRIAGKPAHHVHVEVEDDELRLVGEVEETRFHFFKVRMTTVVSLRLGDRTLRIHDTITNLSASATATQMLYHVNFGPPLLDAGARVVLPAKMVVPRNDHAASAVANWDNYAAPQPGYEEMVYFFELAGAQDRRTQTLLRNAHGTLGATLHFSLDQLPCFTLWKNTTALEDGCVTGLEPGTNFPNPRSFEGRHGREKSLGPGESLSYELAIQCHSNDVEVHNAEQAIRKLQADVVPTVFDTPQSDWCA
ncbi:MAG: aldose 1-epimerase family protein [Planctomycetales bacterium]|nr:aldose 1-epimerase family protein [Planctomycetales bacterium]